MSDPAISDLALLHKNNIYTKPYNIMHVNLKLRDSDRVQYTRSPIVAIDPKGSLDYDDAFHIEGDKIYVHIADVDHYFPKEGVYEDEISKRLTTVYCSNICNMLPPMFSNDIISLNTNGIKKTITVELQFLNDVLVPIKVYLSDIHVKHNLTYDQAHKKKHQVMFADIFRLTGTQDIHKVIEKLMIIANSYIAETLYTANIVFLRSCEKDPVLMSDLNIECLSYLHNKNKKAAQYTTEDQSHELLGLKHYTHFTSPIRRYADLIVQRLLKSILYNEPVPYSNEELSHIAGRINECNVRVKRYYKDASILKLHNKVGDNCINTKGYVVNYKPESNVVTVYLTEYNIEYNYALYSEKLKHLWTVYDTGNILTIKSQCNCITVPKYTELDVTLSTNSQELQLNKKIIMRICLVYGIYGISDI